jgi:hypothetical protein
MSEKFATNTWLVGVLLLGCGAADTGPGVEGDGEPVAVETEAATTCAPLLRTWEDPNVYPANANPYKRRGIFHAMSYAPDSPIFAPAARVGEVCTYRAGSLHYKTVMKEDCLAPGEGCVALCAP